MLASLLRGGWTWARNQDLLVLLLSLALVSGLWGFIELATEVREGETHEIDNAILRAFRNPRDLADPLGPPWVKEAVRDVTALGGVMVLSLVTGAVAGFLLLSRKHHALLLLTGALAGGLLLNWSLKNYFDRARPEYVTPLHHVDSYSFPSGHSLLASVVYLTLGALLAQQVARRRLKLYVLGIAVLLTVLVGVSRVYLGVHYPTDVLAGWTVGFMWAIACWLLSRYLQRRGKVERPAESTA
jgi:undecaprenyl-diphosphatase